MKKMQNYFDLESLEGKVNKFLNQTHVHPKCKINEWWETLNIYRVELTKSEDERVYDEEILSKYLYIFAELIENNLKLLQAEYDWILENQEKINKAIKSGEIYTSQNLSGGWVQTYNAVDIQNKTVQVFKDGYGIYNGNNGKPLTLN